jgi:hypothetical protein
MFDGSFLEPSNPATHHFTWMHFGWCRMRLFNGYQIGDVAYLMASNFGEAGGGGRRR